MSEPIFSNKVVSIDRERFDCLCLVLHDQPVNVTGYINGYIKMKFPAEILSTYQLDSIREEFNTMFIDNGIVLSELGLEQFKEKC